MLPMTNVINSLYARQASTKTKAAHRARASSGMYMGSHAPFGYQKDPKDRHHLIVDPDAADVVKDIFQMFADGIGYVRMTKILRERKVLNPQAYFNQNNPDYYKNSDYWRKPFDWHATSVRVILNNPVYLGNVVFGRTKTKGFFDKQRIEADKSEWIVKENTHEAIITRELWDTVHQMMKARRRENSTGTVQPFAGLVKCADCGSSLNVSYDKKKGRYNGFTCWVYKNYGKERCTSHAIGWVTLNQLVLEDIRRNAYEAKTAASEYMQMLVDVKTEKQKAEIDRCKRELKKADKRIEELTKILNIRRGITMKVSFFDRAALEQRLKMDDVLDVVEGVYKSKAEGKTVVWPTVTHHFEDRGAVMDIRSGYDRGSEVYGAKLLATFPENEKRGLPPFSGILVAMDGTTGLPKGIMDASFITSMRTGAAAAVSARALARPESDTLLVLGTGRQSLFMIGAALTAMKNIKTVYCAEPMNLDAAKPYAAACPQRMQEMFGLDASDVQFIPVSDLAESVGKADIIITITRATKPLISRDWVKPGTHLSCIGADMPGKEEVDPAILRDAVVYVDDVDQCVNAGECELAVKGGYMTREHISGQIGEVLLGAKKGRTSADEITVFDATGLALLDLAVAKKVVEEAGDDPAHTIEL